MVHFDLSAAKATIKAKLKDEARQREEMIRANDPDVVIDEGFIRAQSMFDDVRLDHTINAMKCENLGFGRNQALGAAAKALGDMLGTLTLGCVGQNERMIVKMCFDRALAEAIMGPAPAADETMTAVEGGHA